MLQALVAFKLYKSMAHEVEDDDMEVDSANELLSYAQLVNVLFVKPVGCKADFIILN